jgi:hypothetical protein
MRVAGVVLALLGFATWLEGNSLSAAALVEPILAVVLIAAIALALGDRLDGIIDSGRALMLRPSARTFLVMVSAFVVAASVGFAWYCLNDNVWVVDEATQRFQARLLLTGHLWLPAEPLREFFETRQTVMVDGRWFGEFPVGGPLLMAIGEVIRAPWVINPIVAALGVAALYRFLSRVTDESSARAASLLLALCPFALFMSGSEMSHPKTLTSMLVALCGLEEWTTALAGSRRRWGAIVVGVGVGGIVLIRPYDAVLIALPIAVFQLAVVIREPRRAVDLLWQGAIGSLAVIVVLATNKSTTGDWFHFTYDVINGPAHQPGFHTDPSGFPFTPMRGLDQIALYLARINTLMLEWPVPALAFLSASLLIRKATTRWDLLLIGLVGSVLTGYWAYWHFGDAFGPRFLYPLVPMFLLYIVQLPSRVAGIVENAIVRRATWVAIPACVIIAWLPAPIPGRFTGVWLRAAAYRSTFVPATDVRAQLADAYANDKLALAFPDVGNQLSAAHLHNALVFVREAWYVRLASRLRTLGQTPFGADRVTADLDACVLQEALNREDANPQGTDEDRLRRVIQAGIDAGRGMPDPSLPPGAAHLMFVPGRPLSPACQNEIAGDSVGTVPLWYFLPYTTFDASGRIGGDVVFVRDLGAHNETLRQRFGDRTWYRYRRDTPSAPFEPYNK